MNKTTITVLFNHISFFFPFDLLTVSGFACIIASGNSERRRQTRMQFSDFDFHIDEILLVHKNSLVPQFKWTGYRGGRKMDGLVFSTGGEALFDFGEEHITLLPGNMIFLPANSNYTVKCAGRESFQHYTINFRLRDIHVDEAAFAAEILRGRQRHITDSSLSSRYSGHFEQLLSVWQGKNPGYMLMAKSYLYELLYLYLTDANHSLRSQSGYARLGPALKVLDTAYMENQSVAELAELCGMSETHFRRLFHRFLGKGPAEYRISKRILYAKDLLTAGQYTVAEISRTAGFSDPSYFSRVFRAHTGMSPVEFMQK